MVKKIMEDEEDLDSLRAAALSSLLKNKSSTRSCNSNTLFHRPTVNKNLISIIPVEENSEQDGNDVSKYRSQLDPNDGHQEVNLQAGESEEYVVIEEGDDVDDEEVDEIIEEVVDDDEDPEGVIVTEEILESGDESAKDDEEIIEEEEIEEDEDALSFASNDSFLDVIHSLENEKSQTDNSLRLRKPGVQVQDRSDNSSKLNSGQRVESANLSKRQRSRSPTKQRQRSMTRSRSRSFSPGRRKNSPNRRGGRTKNSRIAVRNSHKRPTTSRRDHSRDRSPSFRSRRELSPSRHRRDASPGRSRYSHSPSARDVPLQDARKRDLSPLRKSRRENASLSPSDRASKPSVSRRRRDISPHSRLTVSNGNNVASKRSNEDNAQQDNYKVTRTGSPNQSAGRRSSPARSNRRAEVALVSKALRSKRDHSSGSTGRTRNTRSSKSPKRDKPENRVSPVKSSRSRSPSPDSSKPRSRRDRERDQSPKVPIPSLFSNPINCPNLETDNVVSKPYRSRSRSPPNHKRKSKRKTEAVQATDRSRASATSLQKRENSPETNKLLESRRAKFEQSSSLVVGSVAKKIKLSSKTGDSQDSDSETKSVQNKAHQTVISKASSSTDTTVTTKPIDDHEDLRTKLTQKRATAASRLFTSALKSTLVVVEPKTVKSSNSKNLDENVHSRNLKSLDSAPSHHHNSTTSSRSKRKVSLIR